MGRMTRAQKSLNKLPKTDYYDFDLPDCQGKRMILIISIPVKIELKWLDCSLPLLWT